MDKKIVSTQELIEYMRMNEKETDVLGQYSQAPTYHNKKFHLTAIDPFLQDKIFHSTENELDAILETKKRLIPLSKLTNELLIDFDLKAENKSQVLSRLARIAYTAGLTASYEDLFIALEERERFSSTALENGIAIPHSRVSTQKLFKKPSIIVARICLGVDFDAPDERKTYLFFMPCAPTQFEHIRLLAKIAKFVHLPNVVDRLKNTSSREDVIHIIEAFEELNLLPGDMD